MSARTHTYSATVRWTGNQGSGTSGYKAYGREHTISIAGKPDIAGSSDPAFRGDATRHNPEDLLVSSISACHMLWYLHLCAEAGVVVLAYEDAASGVMRESGPTGGRFESVTLAPVVTITSESSREVAIKLHDDAHARCFIANSVNFPVSCRPSIVLAS